MQSTLRGLWTPEQVPQPVPVPEGGWLVVDLYCSIGGVSMAAKQLGHTMTLAVDYDGYRLQTHRLNHPECAHECLELGTPEARETLLAKIEELVPQDQRHRLWVHASPPCTLQSGIRLSGKKRTALNYASHDAAQRSALGLVQWTLDLIVELNPAQWSFEEVNTRITKGTGLDADGGTVQGILNKMRRTHGKFVDYDIFQMADFGVPQQRKRLIAAKPATINQMRHASALRVGKHVPTREALEQAGCPPPKNAAFIQGPHMRKPNREKMAPSPIAEGKHTDGKVELYDVALVPGPTVVSRKLAWCTRDYHNCHDADSSEAGYLTAAQTIALMTFPQDFRWCDDMKTETLQVNALGNAIPVRFAEAFFRAASPLE